MKLSAAEINEAERVIFAIMEELDLTQIRINRAGIDGQQRRGMLNEQYRQRLNEQATESPF